MSVWVWCILMCAWWTNEGVKLKFHSLVYQCLKAYWKIFKTILIWRSNRTHLRIPLKSIKTNNAIWFIYLSHEQENIWLQSEFKPNKINETFTISIQCLPFPLAILPQKQQQKIVVSSFLFLFFWLLKRIRLQMRTRRIIR